MFSTVPGFERPRVSRRWEKESYVLRRARIIVLSCRYGGRSSDVLTSPIVSYCNEASGFDMQANAFCVRASPVYLVK